jgi:hypothetical protein
MNSEEILTILLPELIEDVEELMPVILPPEEGLEHFKPPQHIPGNRG